MNEHNPYRAPAAEVADVTVSGELELAGRGHRFGAFVIDTVILVAILVPLFLSAVLGSKMLDFFVRDDSIAGSLAEALIGFTVFAIVQSWFLKKHGQTIGKKLVGIRMVDLAGNPPGLWRLLSRRYSVMYLINLLPGAWALLGALDFIFIFRRDRRCVHDLVAGTRVVLHGAKHSSATWVIAPLATAAVLGIGAAVVAPMFDSAPRHKPAPKPAHAAAPAGAHPQAAPSTHPAPAQAAPNRPAPPAAPQAAAAPAPAVADTPTATEPAARDLRKCATLESPAAIIRCSQGGK